MAGLFFIGCKQQSKINFSLSSSGLARIRDAKYVQVSSYDTTGGNNDRINIHAGKKAVIFDETGPGMITRIWITIDSRDPHFLRRILLKIYWDDETEPSVEVPVGDFFGSPFEYKHFAAENIGMTSGGYYCYFPMPFNKRARIEVDNQTGQEIYAFYFHIGYYQMPDEFDDQTGYFHAQWKRDVRTDYPENYMALHAQGKGQFVGINFSGQSYNKSLFYLEGDEMIYVDGEQHPSIYGTGLEDYFTSGWYFKNGEFSEAFHGLVLKDDETGRITAYRHHIRDAIPFKKEIKVTFEHGHGNEQSVDFSTTAFWYQIEPHETFPEMLLAGQRIPLRRPVPNGAIEAEDLQVDDSTAVGVEDMAEFGSDWSNNKHLLIQPTKSQSITLTIPDLREKAYDVDVYTTKGPNYGDFNITYDNKIQGQISGHHQVIFPADPIRLNNLETRNNSLRLKFTAQTPGTKIGIDAFVLTPVRNYIPEWYMIGPFPNPRESDYLRYGLDSVYAPEREIKLETKYEGVNGQQISWEKVDGRDAGYGMALWDRYDPYEFVVCYALTYIFSPEAQPVPLMFSSDDGAKVFLNDEEIYRFLEVNIAYPDQEEINLDLQPGWNKLLIKVENNFGGYAFYGRLIDRRENLIMNVDLPGLN